LTHRNHRRRWSTRFANAPAFLRYGSHANHGDTSSAYRVMT
jgi:hypothetical protein